MKQTGIPSTETMADEVRIAADCIRSRILRGQYAPGERIFETQLARELGFRRPHVREAARQLENDRLLVFRPNLGFLVRQLTVSEFIDLVDVRVGVERHAARTLVRRADLQVIANELSALADRIEDCVKRRDIEAEADVDLEFHEYMVAATGNRLLKSIYQGLKVELRISMRAMGGAAADWNTLPQQHRDVVAALLSGDAGVAERAVGDHITLSWSGTIEQLRLRNDMPLSLSPHARGSAPD